MSKYEEDEARRAGFDYWFDKAWWNSGIRLLEDEYIVPILMCFIVALIVYEIIGSLP